MNREQFYEIMSGEGTLDYELYLNTKALLSCQSKFEELCNPDELQFQLVHQVEELWMKLIAYTLLDIDDYLQQENTNRVLTLFRRVHATQRMMIQQLGLLETMSPKEYQDIQQRLGNGSGQETAACGRARAVRKSAKRSGGRAGRRGCPGAGPALGVGVAMTRYPRLMRRGSDPRTGSGGNAGPQHADRKRDDQQQAGRGGGAGQQAGGTHLGQHAEQVPERAEPDHASTIASRRTPARILPGGRRLVEHLAVDGDPAGHRAVVAAGPALRVDDEAALRQGGVELDPPRQRDAAAHDELVAFIGVRDVAEVGRSARRHLVDDVASGARRARGRRRRARPWHIGPGPVGGAAGVPVAGRV